MKTKKYLTLIADGILTVCEWNEGWCVVSEHLFRDDGKTRKVNLPKRGDLREAPRFKRSTI